MIKHSLVCLLQNEKNYGYKTLRLSSDPKIEDFQRVYNYNVNNLKKIIEYCQHNNIPSLRVTSSLFPLSTHKKYQEKVVNIIDDALSQLNNFDYKSIELSMHPDQFILLSSINENVNLQSRYDLELNAYIAKKIPIKLINIHIGSKVNGLEFHKDILSKNISQLSIDVKNLLSFENDEKSYDFQTTLDIAQENGIMMVADFHHERCYQRRKSNYLLKNEEIDMLIYENFEKIISTYKNKNALPTFHISSPINGWTGNFKEECSHADYINITDYPHQLKSFANKQKQEVILDIEAKHKQLAIYELNNKLKN